MWDVREKWVKDNIKVFGINNWKDGVVNGMRIISFGEKIRGIDVNLWILICIVDI